MANCALVSKRWLIIERRFRITRRLNNLEHKKSFDWLKRTLDLLDGHLNDKSIDLFEEDACDNPLSFQSVAGLTALAKGLSNLEKLSFASRSDYFSLSLMSIASNSPNLKSLELVGCNIKDLAVVGKSCKQLEDLNLRFCEDLTDIGLVDLVIGCGKSLKSLAIEQCDNITDVSLEAVASHCKSLETLSLVSHTIHNRGVIAVARGCPLIKVLRLVCISITNEALITVGSCCLSLETLSLIRSQLTDRGLCAIGNGCKKLKSPALLDIPFSTDKGLEDIAGLEAIAAGCKELVLLSVCQAVDTSCKKLLRYPLCSLHRFGFIRPVSIGPYCPCFACHWFGHISRVGQSLDIIQRNQVGNEGTGAWGIQKIGGVGLIAIARGCPQLNHIDLSCHSNLSDTTLTKILESCPSLKHVGLNGCPQITDVSLAHLAKNCTMLESISMYDCKGITESGVDIVIFSCANLKMISDCKISQKHYHSALKKISFIY